MNNKDEILTNTLNQYIKDSDWEDAKTLLESELLQTPNDYWLLTSLAIIHYELRDYALALSISEKALRINPKDYLVLDYHATILSVIHGKEQDAIRLLRKIIGSDINKIAYGRYGEGLRWAKSIVNDCRVRLALVYELVNKRKEALMLYDQHLSYRQRGLFSNFTKAYVLKKKQSLALNYT